MSLLVSLQKLLSFGEQSYRPSLVEFAIHDYAPANQDPEFLDCWRKLVNYLRGEGVPDAALTGLHTFLQQVPVEDHATVCLSLKCDVSFDVADGTLCMDAHDDNVACCSSQCMIDEIQTLINRYDTQYN